MSPTTGRLLRGPALVASVALLAACGSDGGGAERIADALAAARAAGPVIVDDAADLAVQTDVDTVLDCLGVGTVDQAPAVSFDGAGSPGVAIVDLAAPAVDAVRGAAGAGSAFSTCVHDARFGELGNVSEQVTLDVTTAPHADLGDAAVDVEVRLHAGPFGLGNDIVVVAVDRVLVVGRVSSEDAEDIDHAPFQAPLEAAVRALG
jgi:hypothetical protein